MRVADLLATSVPEGWNEVPLFAVANGVARRNTGNREQAVLSLSYGRIIGRDVDRNFGLLPESFETYNIVEPGNVVLRLTDLQNDKRSLRTGLVRQRGIITSAYTTLEFSGRLLAGFGHYYLHALDIRKVFYGMGGGVRQSMNYSDIRRIPLLVPPVERQHEITDFLDQETERIDRLVEKKRRLIDLLEEKRAALISHAVTKGLDPTVPMMDSGMLWLGDVPAHWTEGKLRHLIDSEVAGVWGEDAHDGADDLACVRVADFDRRKALVSTEKLTTRSIPPDQRVKRELRRGDLLLERSGGGDHQPVGYAVMFDHGFEAVCSNFVSRLRVVSGSDPRFVTYVLGSAYARRINVKSIKQTTGIQNLDYRSYLNEPWVFPSGEEQSAIATYLDHLTAQIDLACDKIAEQLDKLAEYRQALITAAVTGQIDLTAEGAEPEEMLA